MGKGVSSEEVAQSGDWDGREREVLPLRATSFGVDPTNPQ